MSYNHVSRLLVLVLVSVLAGCYASGTSSSGTIRPVQRVAAQDQAIRALLLDVAAANLCEQIEGTFLALPDQNGPSGVASASAPSGGRLWIEQCAAESTDEGQLDLQLRGRGWSWADQSSGGFISFSVQQYVRFAAGIRFLGVADIGYARDRRLVSVWLAPQPGTLPGVSLQMHGNISASPDTVLAAIAGVFIDTSAAAREQAQTQGAEQFQQRLARGFTMTVDLCSGQQDRILGAVGLGQAAERPFPPDGRRWLDNQRVNLRNGGIDVAGPFRTDDGPVRIEVVVESGGPVLVSTPCASDMGPVLDAYFQDQVRESADGSSPQTVMTSATIELPARSECPRVLMAVPAGGENVVYRYRASLVNPPRPPALVRCR
ncbi:MAG: hypothetical protein IT379_27675 [Deltaproteobacteria bacterium]|nr:hypothetical protein [Deltaproteobacteria bacterium]